jgi:hypothetical protein
VGGGEAGLVGAVAVTATDPDEEATVDDDG